LLKDLHLSGSWRGNALETIFLDLEEAIQNSGVHNGAFRWLIATFICLLKQVRRPRRRSSGYRRQVSNSYQVVSRGGELEDPTHQLQAAVARLAQQPDGLQPTEDLFHSFAFPLTNQIARMTGRASINSRSNSVAGKYFAEAAEHAEQWGMALYLEGKSAFKIVDAKIPTVQADKFMRWERVDNIGPARFAELNQLKDAVIPPVQ